MFVRAVLNPHRGHAAAGLVPALGLVIAALFAALIATLISTVVLASSGAPHAGAAEGDVMSVPKEIDSSGRTDVTVALNTFFRTIPSGATVEFRSDGRYRIEGIVQIDGLSNLTIEGNGATLFAETDGRDQLPPRRAYRNHWPRRREHLTLNRVTNVTIRDLEVIGANPNGGADVDSYVPDLEGQAGIAIIGGIGITLEGVTISDTYGDLVYITGGATDVTVSNSRLVRSGRQAIAVVNGRDVLIEGSTFDGIGRSVLDLEPLGKGIALNVRFVDNKVGDYLNFLLAAVGGGAGVDGIEVADNKISATRGLSVVAGIERAQRNGLRIVANRGTARAVALDDFGSGALIQLTNLNGVEIRDNRQQVASGVAITLDRVCNVEIADNSFPGSSQTQETLADCGADAAPATPTTASGQAQDPPPPTAPSGDLRFPPADVGQNSGPGWGGAAFAALAGLVVGGAGGWWARSRYGARRAQTRSEAPSQST